jgi:predicted SAM-dependent methyltransferase
MRQVPSSDLRINLGSGRNRRPGFINVDLTPGADYRLDLREPLPFRDGSTAEVYSEHFLEHLEYPSETSSLLRECYRVLRSGGRVSMGVPDGELMLDDYAKGDNTKFEMLRRYYHPEWCDLPMHHVNWFFRQNGEHRYAYDFDTLASALESAGFVDIRRRDWDSAQDHESRRWGTLYIAATRP